MTGGEWLKNCREKCGLTVRAVESASTRLAQRKQDERYRISKSTISAIESNGIVPTVHKLYSLASVYGCEIRDILESYGVGDPLSEGYVAVPNTHVGDAPHSRTLTFRRVIASHLAFESIGQTSIITSPRAACTTCVARALHGEFRYGYVGTNDEMMYPLLMPGSLVQIDESKTIISEGGWRNEYERPIYFVETRDRCFCCWCERRGPSILLVPHPLSPERTRVYLHKSEVEVIGQVVAVAMRLRYCADRRRERLA